MNKRTWIIGLLVVGGDLAILLGLAIAQLRENEAIVKWAHFFRIVSAAAFSSCV